MSMQYCMKCMDEQFPRVSVCPRCGTPYHQSLQKANALRPGHILNGKYLVGAILGEGGFGITYIGLDLELQKKVAIKEYFPVSTGMVSRCNNASVMWCSEVSQENGESSALDCFLQEARKLAKVDSIPCVVSVRSIFFQNNTAYIVMDYIEGETLAQKLQREGPISFADCVSILTPIIQALEQVHRLGIIHRDISPDNIMIQPNGSLMLLDLGAAKEIDIQKKDGSIQSSRLVAKEGFSPLEQYSTSGRIGTWTDVYAMAATIYYCCTGKLPSRATDRIGTDTLTCIKPLSEKEFAVLKQGMALNGKDRIQTMGELLKLLHTLIKAPKPEKSGVQDKLENAPVCLPRNLLSLINDHPWSAAAALLFAEALVFQCMVFISETIDYGHLLRVAGYLLSASALIGAEPNRKLFCTGCVFLCLAYRLMYTMAGWVGCIAMLLVPVLLLSGKIGIPHSREWPEKYWLIPVAGYCVFLIMYCVESFQLQLLILECISGCAFTLAMRVFALQKQGR